MRRDHPGDDEYSGNQHDRQTMGLQPASHVAARPAHVKRRKSVGESARPSAESMADYAALARVKTK